MADKLTQQQLAAVKDRGRGLLVSAAAGSGKTKVLVERLFSYVECEGADLDDFLIITYTRAAAAELRGKIAAALGERLQSDPSNAHLQRQLLRVYRADIKTVDAFCASLLRENCHLLGEDEHHRTLRPDFRVLDEQEAEALRRRVLAPDETIARWPSWSRSCTARCRRRRIPRRGSGGRRRAGRRSRSASTARSTLA